MKILRSIVVASCLALSLGTAVTMSACSTVGVAAPQSPSQAIAYGYGSVAALRTQAAQGLASGAVSVATAQKVLVLTDQARTYLDAAKAALASGDTSTTSGQLALAAAIITQVQGLLPVTAKPL